jgi:hypothetical protein
MGCIILISGKQGSGKSSLGRNLKAKLEELGNKVETLAYADPLYKIHHAMRNILQSYGADDMDPSKIDGPFLQIIGTSWGRETRHPDIWVNILKKRVKEVGTFYIIDDCRIQNEMDAFNCSPMRVLKIRLEAPEHVRKLRAKKWRTNTQHLSEIGLDHYNAWDLTLDTEALKPEETCNMAWQEILKQFPTNN